MNKQELLDKLQIEIGKLKIELDQTNKNDYLSKGIILGKINGLLTAKLTIINMGE